MMFVAYAFVFALGCCVGSFLNVCVYRLPRDLSLVRPGSHCPSCNEAIAWYDNLPVVSWLSLGGLCRRCGVLISPRYLLVELVTGGVFLWVYAAHRAAAPSVPLAAPATLAAYAALAAALIASSFVDIERMVIPDEISIGGMYAGPALCIAFPAIIARDDVLTRWVLQTTGMAGSERFGALAASILGMALGAGVIMGAAIFGRALFRKEAMGFGDVKFMGMVGAFIGWPGALLTFFVACMLGAVIGILLLIRRRDTHIPFGPYLAAGTLIVMLHFDAVRYAAWNFPEIIRSWFS